MKIDDLTEFLTTARDRFEFGRQADAVDREAAEDDNRFAYADDKNLDQWDKAAKKIRGKKRPILQWNRIPTYTQRIANDSRKNKPSIKISRGDEEATAHTAEYLQARIRHIEYECNIDTARDTAGKQQVTTGRAFMRVSTEWIEGTQKQRICVDPIPNQFSVVWDPGAVKYDHSDAGWCFVVTQLTREAHTEKYGKEATEAALDFAAGENGQMWVNVGESGEMIQVADYWYKEWESRTVPAEGDQPARTERVQSIYSCAIDGAQILKPVEKWLGSNIGIIPQWGEEAIVDGQRRTFSLIRNVKTPQRDLNLAVSSLAEHVGQMPKTPYLVPEGGIAANREQDWQNALNTPLAYLYYQQYDPNDALRPLNKPERITHEPPIQACLEWMHECIDGIKSGMGIFDAALGAKSNEQSGVAIERRKVQGEITNLHFPDNAARSNKYLGEMLVELIIKLEKGGGSYPIRTEQGKTHIVPIGVEHPDWKTGEPVTHDLGTGKYGVTVSTGPSYDSQRQELQERDQNLITANPDLMWVFGDQMFANDDTPGAEERADRMKRAIQMKTPGLIEDKTQQPDPQALQQKVMQLGQQLQATEAFAKDLHQKLEGKQLELDNQVKLKTMDIAFSEKKLQVDDENAKLKIASVEGIAELQQQIAVLESRMDRAHEIAKLQHTQAGEAEAQAADHAHATETQQGQQEHESSESEAQRTAAAESQQQAQDHASQEADLTRQAAEAQGEE